MLSECENWVLCCAALGEVKLHSGTSMGATKLHSCSWIAVFYNQALVIPTPLEGLYELPLSLPWYAKHYAAKTQMAGLTKGTQSILTWKHWRDTWLCSFKGRCFQDFCVLPSIQWQIKNFLFLFLFSALSESQLHIIFFAFPYCQRTERPLSDVIGPILISSSTRQPSPHSCCWLHTAEEREDGSGGLVHLTLWISGLSFH